MTAPWNWLNRGDPNAGQGMPYGRQPYVPQKVSILDRLAARLFPATQGLDPSVSQGVGRQGLLNIGTNLLQAGGPQAQQQGTLANIGAAIGGVDIQGLTQQALKMQAYRQQQMAQHQAAEVVMRHPAKPGETPEDRFGRFSDILSELAGIPGTEHLIGPLSNVMQSLKPDRAQFQLRASIDPTTKQPILTRVNMGTGASDVVFDAGGKPVRPVDPTQYITDDQGNVYLARGTQGSGVQGVRGKTAGAGLTQEKAAAGARTAIQAIDDAESLYSQGPEVDVLPLGAALARGAKTGGGLVGAIAGAAEPLAQQSMTPGQQQFQADMQRMVHSMVGLLPGSRQSVTLFNSLVNAYTPQPSEAPQARAAKRAARQRAKVWLAAVSQGQKVPILPELAEHGITDSDVTVEGAAPVASPAQPPAPVTPAAPAYNPKFWRRRAP